jgi:hypothetical protein
VSPFTTTICASLVAFGIAPQEDVARESVDLIELNHFYDEHGRLVFDQVIFFDWSASESRYNVRAWRLVKNPSQLPQRDWAGGGYSAMWQDGEQIRHIRSKSIRETWTQYDPELVEREYLPKEKRRELKTVSTTKAKKAAVVQASHPTETRRSESPDPAGAVAATGR